ncbi:MAG: NAD(P)H-dependent oxidoreductase subunit E [Solirubrobacterales bacterium]
MSEPRLRPTDDLTSDERRELIASMTPEDAERVPELHEVDVPAALKERIEAAMGRYPQLRSASIPALWAVQRHHGWCSPEGIRQAAAVMGLTPAYLQSVASFYDLFHTRPEGHHRVLVCHNISCWMNGADELVAAFCRATGVDLEEAAHGGGSSADGSYYVQGFECLGACDMAPMASINEVYFGPLEPADAERAVGELRGGGEVLADKALAKRPAAGGSEPEPDARVLAAEAATGGGGGNGAPPGGGVELG